MPAVSEPLHASRGSRMTRTRPTGNPDHRNRLWQQCVTVTPRRRSDDAWVEPEHGQVRQEIKAP